MLTPPPRPSCVCFGAGFVPCTMKVINATKIGHVQGIFADHATQMLVSPDPDSGALPQICNGKAPLRKCYSFTNEFADAFNAGHSWLVNHTQDMLAAIGGQ